MSRNNHLGTVRRGQVLGYGPGAVIDFRAGAKGGGPVSVIAAALDRWEETAKLSSGMNDPHVIREARLEKVLGKSHFRLPPVDDAGRDAAFPNRWLNGYRFPTWLQCPGCKSLKPASRWARDMGDPSRWCARCSSEDRRVFVVPSRFVTACENGHIDEFPWIRWLAMRSGVSLPCLSAADDDGHEAFNRCRLRLESAGGSGIEGLRVSCSAEGCGASASMAGAFSSKGLDGHRCGGRRPWLTSDRESCTMTPRTLQRGASNLYFPVTYSTLSIPPWTDAIQEELKAYWSSLRTLEPAVRDTVIAGLAETNASVHNMERDEYAAVIRERLKLDEGTSFETLRFEEFIRLEAGAEGRDFQVRQEAVPPSLQPLVARIGRVERLREVRALTGFKRIYQNISVSEPGRGRFGDLSLKALPWLPAVEVRGEGIFVSLRLDTLDEWIARSGAAERAARVQAAHAAEHERLHDGAGEVEAISPAFLLVHSLAHAVIKRLSFECGYDVASLRERLYIDENPRMAGFLIYTSTSDADGTLGGLERQGRAERIEQILLAALRDCVWCSSDPLCRSGISSLSESMNLAACHSCLLLPETCCERGNRFLDRGMLVGDGADTTAGFFDSLDAFDD
ncbi:MAG: DUF1998 domain-containing protein [Sphingopyxis sp.]|nr:DUF1998 domain-containing protein [Sphingopyxis sp.]